MNPPSLYQWTNLGPPKSMSAAHEQMLGIISALAAWKSCARLLSKAQAELDPKKHRSLQSASAAIQGFLSREVGANRMWAWGSAQSPLNADTLRQEALQATQAWMPGQLKRAPSENAANVNRTKLQAAQANALLECMTASGFLSPAEHKSRQEALAASRAARNRRQPSLVEITAAYPNFGAFVALPAGSPERAKYEAEHAAAIHAQAFEYAMKGVPESAVEPKKELKTKFQIWASMPVGKERENYLAAHSQEIFRGYHDTLKLKEIQRRNGDGTDASSPIAKFRHYRSLAVGPERLKYFEANERDIRQGARDFEAADAAAKRLGVELE